MIGRRVQAGEVDIDHRRFDTAVAHDLLQLTHTASGAPESAYFEWKSVLPYSDDEVRSIRRSG